MTEILNIDGQKVVFNPERKIIKTTIETPFMSAGKHISWNPTFGIPGIGLNLKLIELTLKTNSTLIIYIISTPTGPIEKDYWITADRLKDFLTKHSTDYKIRNTILKVIPWSILKSHIQIPA